MLVHWKPHPRQEFALLRAQDEIDEILYGGARGGGKTDMGMVWLIEPKYLQEPKYRALVIRKNSDDLKDWIDRARNMYLPLGADFAGNPAEIRFRSGAKIRTGHLNDAGAYSKYQGHEYQKMLIEELTQISRQADFEKLMGSNRSTIPGLRPQFLGTTNPDGDGHDWVNQRFDCEHPDEKVREFLEPKTGIVRRRLFIPSKVEDNPTLIENNPGYVAYLNSIEDPVLRRQWREGSWEEPFIEGAYYAEQLKMGEYRVTSVPHDPFLSVYTFWDLGIDDAMAIWFVQFINKEIRVIDYLEAEGEGIQYYAQQLKDKGYTYERHYMPHDVEVRELSTGVSRKQTFEGLGIKPIMTVPNIGITDGIQAVRSILPFCWFDKVLTSDGRNALKNYKKEYDEKRACFKNQPVHNWASNGADAFRMLAVAHRSLNSNAKELEIDKELKKLRAKPTAASSINKL